MRLAELHLCRLCAVFGESTTVGQQCRLPKVSNLKQLWRNDIIDVVCGPDVAEAVFNLRTAVNDEIGLKFDSCSVLFVTVRYQCYAYTANSLIQAECDPLLSALIG